MSDAAPQQGVPSDEELHDCKGQAVGDYLRSLAGTNAAIFSAEQLMDAEAAGLRAVLTRYGTHPAPVPVAERLPVAEDCDAEGRCWWWAPKDPECPLTGHDSWGLYSGACIEDTHWLPHWALPLPQEAQP
jgi:hypothetical protein